MNDGRLKNRRGRPKLHPEKIEKDTEPLKRMFERNMVPVMNPDMTITWVPSSDPDYQSTRADGYKKECGDCGESKSEEHFRKSSSNPDKLETFCKLCKRARDKQWRFDNPEKYEERKARRNQYIREMKKKKLYPRK
jgi:hypothetical protein